MPTYNDLRPQSDFDLRDYARVFPELDNIARLRIIENLVRLKGGLQTIPTRKTDQNLLVASWNIKEFGHTRQRLPEAYFYIAEILERFDLIAIQEVKSSLKDLEIIMRLLGRDWRYLITDITGGTDGDRERSAYLYNTKRVDLSGLAGEITLWRDLTDGAAVKQLKRTPYMTGFLSGWKKFALISLHLQPGKTDQNLKIRQEEVRLLLAALAKQDEHLWTENLIILGDMNLYHGDDDPTVDLFNNHGFGEVAALQNADTNASQSQAYDRMFLKKNNYFQLAHNSRGQESGGVFNPFDHVYRDGDSHLYRDEICAVYTGDKDLRNDPAALEKQYLHYWRRNQISDHFPIWIELIVDNSSAFLLAKQKELLVV